MNISVSIATLLSTFAGILMLAAASEFRRLNIFFNRQAAQAIRRREL